MENYENLSVEPLPNEEWRDIVGWEGFYKVSNLGRVKSEPRVVEFRDGRKRFYRGKLIRDKRVGTGYRCVSLFRNCFNEDMYVHRLVATVFLDNPNNLCDINHVDGCKANNVVENLEWCSRSENIKHAYDIGLRKTHIDKAVESRSKAVLQFKEDGTFVAEYPSATDAAKINSCAQSAISHYCRGGNKHKKVYKGFIWKYKEDYERSDN